MEKYRPLPHSLTIKASEIEGAGIFTTEFIKAGTVLGTSHFHIKEFIIRTPLGGFLNHSLTPNCKRVELRFTYEDLHYKKSQLITIKDIKKGQELTVEYKWYKV